MSARGLWTGGRKQSPDGDPNRTALSSFRRKGLDRIEAQRLQRLPGSPVRNEKRELSSADDLAVRTGLLLAGIELLQRRVRGVFDLRITVHDINGQIAAEGGGGDRPDQRKARDFDGRVSEVEDGDGGAERRVGEEGDSDHGLGK